MTADYEYRLLYSRGDNPVLSGADLRIELETTGVPPGGVRWQFSTRYRPSKPSYRDVLLQSILDMCKQHKLTPLEIRYPLARGFVDVIFANGEDVVKVYDHDVTFDFYGTKPKLSDRATPDRKHIALCIQTLPSYTNFQELLTMLKNNVRIRDAGRLIDVWSLHCPESGTFKGRILVLLELKTQNGIVTLEARASIPGWVVFREIAYLVRFPDRPIWCVNCRYDETGPFHSIFTCPSAPCRTCKKVGHASTECVKRLSQVAKKKRAERNDGDSSEEEDAEGVVPRAASKDRASMERRFAELGITDGSKEADELARDFGVLALSADDFSN